MEKSYPQSFIDMDDISAEWLAAKINHVKIINKIEKVYKNKKGGLIRKIKLFFLVFAQKLESKFRTPLKTKFERENALIYGGSTWWILNDRIMKHILKEWKNKSKISKLLRHTGTPDETYFQTMSANSPYLSDIKIIPPNEKKEQASKTFANFITPTKSFRGHPHTILVEDYDRIMAKDQFFARKFDLNEDSKILDMIDLAIKN